MKIYIHTFGCKVNSYESAAMAQLLRVDGHEILDSEADADAVIINSCTVTANGDKKVRQYLRKIRRGSLDVILALTGCLPQAYPAIAANYPEADIVTGTGSRTAIGRQLTDFAATRQRAIEITPNSAKTFEPLPAESIEGHTRAFLKIEDGCDRFCAYCIIPHARGPVRSMPLANISAAAERFAQNGYREIVLTGINLSFYGRGNGDDLASAVEAACAVSGIERVRLGSLEPDLLIPSLLDRLAAQEKLCPHFHLSLQSGCDATLTRMNRHYTTAQFAAVAQDIRARFERPTFTTDVLVGFPGETEAEFAESLDFTATFGFLKCHVFPYSARPGTPGATMPDQITKAVKDARTAAMSEATDRARQAVLKSFVGFPERVIIEQSVDGQVGGYTDRYLPALARGKDLLTGAVVRGYIQGIEDGYCVLDAVAQNPAVNV